MIDALINVYADRAGHLSVFHPDDLAHRLTAPSDWWMCGFAMGKDLAAGTPVAFDTAGPGERQVRITDGKLTAKEKTYAAFHYDFRLTVSHGCVFVDGGELLTSNDQGEKLGKRKKQWAEVPNRSYRVRVHAIRWEDDPEGVDENKRATPNALPNYVLEFVPVSQLSRIDAPLAPPTLDPHETAARQNEPWLPTIRETDDEPLLSEYPFLAAPLEGFDPQNGVHVELTDKKTQVRFFGSDQRLDDRGDDRWVLSPAVDFPAVGVVMWPNTSFSGAGVTPQVGFAFKRLAMIEAVVGPRGQERAKVVVIPRSKTQVPEAATAALKAAFDRYAVSKKPFRKHCRAASFNAEWVVAMSDGGDIAEHVLRLLPLQWTEEAAVLVMSDADRAAWLAGWLTAKAGGK